MENKLKVKIVVINSIGQEIGDSWSGDYDSLHNEEWNEITRGLLDEAVSSREL
jgi:hypothetical protein